MIPEGWLSDLLVEGDLGEFRPNASDLYILCKTLQWSHWWHRRWPSTSPSASPACSSQRSPPGRPSAGSPWPRGSWLMVWNRRYWSRWCYRRHKWSCPGSGQGIRYGAWRNWSTYKKIGGRRRHQTFNFYQSRIWNFISWDFRQIIKRSISELPPSHIWFGKGWTAYNPNERQLQISSTLPTCFLKICVMVTTVTSIHNFQDKLYHKNIQAFIKFIT